MTVDVEKDAPNVGRIRQKNEEVILRAAEEEFALYGFKGASMQKIADRAELPKANLHYYFKNKLGLYTAVLKQAIELWDNTLNDLTPEHNPAEVLPEYIREKIHFARAYPLASRLFAKEIISGAPQLQDYFSDGYQAWFDQRTAVFQSWIDQGKMDPIDPAHLIFLLWSSTQHYADFAVQIESALGSHPLANRHYDSASDTLIHIILKGCGVNVR
ncbi:TetR/AcrR family transcriptional regulator [Neptunomonas phycophila]|jgi:TetR/AcrR family transcriptional regulator|uniref:TetR/AcrR family transcriptional regulator n=1 Tax=Neptunomonas phycophila TaxID=1572645 RepID=A0ABT9EV98_9GAMM|nr:TetR/AcrR family transcriptional regulator [Neptunomonas phycophila]MDP2522986.1 TetR/AcrR family transcriptional regulator [Neptunomonas phycophila]